LIGNSTFEWSEKQGSLQGYVNGGSVGLFLNFSVGFEFGIQIKPKTD